MANNILETLFVVIGLDAGEFQKKSKDSKNQSNELKNTFISLDGVTKVLDSSFLSLAKRAGELFAAYITADAAMDEFKQSIDYASNLDQASLSLNVNVEQLEKWDNAIRKTGGTAAGFQAMLKTFSQHLGTTPQRALDILPTLAPLFQRLSQFQALNYGRLIGLDDPTILALHKGSSALTELFNKQKALGLITKKQADQARGLVLETGNVGQVFRELSATVGETLIPHMISFLVIVENIGIYFRKNSGLVTGALYAIAASAGIAAAAFVVLNISTFGIIAAVAALVVGFSELYNEIKTAPKGSFLDNLFEGAPLALRVLKEIYEIIKSIKNLGGPTDLAGTLTKSLKTDNKTDFKDQTERQAFLQKAKGSLDLASYSRLNNLTPNTTNNRVNNTGGDKTNTVTINTLNINTQATDVESIGSGIGDILQKHLSQANNNLANGQAY